MTALPFYPHQREMIDHILDADRMYHLWPGAIRTGKSLGSAFALLAHMRKYYNRAGVDYILGGHTTSAAMRNIVPYLLRLAQYYRIPHVLKSGAVPQLQIAGNTIHIFGGDKENSQDKVQGMTAAFALIDELTRVTQSFYDMVTTRLSLPNAVMLATMNKDSEYHWTATDVYQPIRDGLIPGHIVEARAEDATGMPSEFFADVRASLPEFRRKRLLENEFAEAEGLVFSQYEIADPPRGSDYVNSLVGADWGMKGTTAAVRMEQHGEDWYVVDEYYHTGRSDGELTAHVHASRILTQLGGWAGIVVDPSAAPLIYALEQLTGAVYYAQNDVSLGLQTVDSAFRLGRLKISPRCVQLLKELSTYVWKKTVDKPEKKDDHAVDALRYATMEAIPLEYAGAISNAAALEIAHVA